MKLLFRASCVFLIFVAGVAVGRYRFFPYPVFQAGKESVTVAMTNLAMATGARPVDFLQPARYPGQGITRFTANHVAPGLTLISSFFDRGTEMRLVRLDGSIVRRWHVALFDVFRDLGHIKPEFMAPRTNWNAEIQGILALPDGSVVFNFDGVGMAKLDRCGTVKWTLPRVTHHSMERSADGGFWVPGQRYVEDRSPFPTLRPPYTEETVLKVSAEGKVIREISVLGIIFKNDLQALLFANGLQGVALANAYPEYPNVITHLNDVEELSAEMAVHFPRFAAGDLLLSLRSLNMVLVVDPATEKIKWHQVGPWIKQHDPDFQANGRISIFNNNPDGSPTGTILGGSTIVEVDPVNGQTAIRYGAVPDQRMFSEVMGKHQALDNGHRLITEAQAGRVFEVDDAGHVVWEFINRYDDRDVAVISQAIRYPEGYFSVNTWTCGG